MVTPPVSRRLFPLFALSACLVGSVTSVARAAEVERPRLIVVGDSTAANDGKDGPVGWGVVLPEYFDPAKVEVLNCARAGRSSRTFFTEGLWQKALDQVRTGDTVLIQFGHNDPGFINDEKRARGSLPGLGLETQEIDNLQTKKHEIVHTFGWYMRRMIDDAKAKGAIPIVLSPTVRNIWTGTVEERGPGEYRDWSRLVARSEGVQFLDLTDLVADEYERRGPAAMAPNYPKDHTHTNLDGAEVNATWVVAGLKALTPDPVSGRFSAKGDGLSPAFQLWAPTPPLGWNSWDAFGTGITEAQARAEAAIMQRVLLPHGWTTFTVDIEWYCPEAKGFNYTKDAPVALDGNGRLLPAKTRFPSAAGGAGFAPLAAYLHSLGLKFGLHLMRGIPRAAVAANMPILGTAHTARDIANTADVCPWNPDMFGVDMTKPGAQAYYDSVFALFAAWGLDYVKVDDMARPYHEAEIEAVRQAIDRSGRPIVLSLSPGATPLTAGKHVDAHANLWRISDDFWDNWTALKEQFGRLDQWTPFRAPGHYPDPDMLPLGMVKMGRPSRFTADEQKTLVTLWSISGSPLILGSDLTKLDAATAALLTNDAVLAVDQASKENHQALADGALVAWVARSTDSRARYVAVFNLADVPLTRTLAFSALAVKGEGAVTDLWSGTPVGSSDTQLQVALPAHGSALYQVVPLKIEAGNSEPPPPPPPGAK